MVEAKHIRLSLVGAGQSESHVFGVEGGTFGRSRTCDWPLPDSERILSSVHGRILFENGAFVLVDESTNGIFLDGAAQALGRGNAVVLGNATRLSAGPYVIEAHAVAPPHNHGHPASYAPPPGQAHGGPVPVYRQAQQAENALHDGDEFGELWGRSSQDPLDYLDAPSNSGGGNLLGDPVAIAGWPGTPQAQIASPVRRQPDITASGGTGAAAAVPSSPSPSSAAGPIPDDFLAGLATSGPRAANLPAPRASQAQAVTPRPSPARIPEDFDPLTALNAGGSPRRRAEPPQPGMIAPAAAPAARVGPKPLSPELMADLVELGSPDATPPAGGGANGDPVSDTLAALRARRVQRKAALRERTTPGAASLPVPPLPPVRHDTPAAALALPAGPAAGEDARAPALPGHVSVKALLEGMGFPEVEMADGHQERLLREIGETVRETAYGLISLLAARRAVKTEFRMDETQVQPEENNPFKFFNVAELALDELFVTRAGGFQPPAEATRSAFEDVQQHSLLTMSAMQRAIRLLFERLSPEVIEREHDEEGGALRVRGLGARKDKWASYVESHARMNGNIDAIARQIVGEAFAQVHEEQARKDAKDYWEKTR